MGAELSNIAIEDLVVLCKTTGAGEAWEEFIVRTHHLVAGAVRSTIRRWGMLETLSADDVVQEVYLRISRNQAAILDDFESIHPNGIFGYVRIVAVNLAHDHCRALSTAKRGAGICNQGAERIERADHPDGPGGPGRIERDILMDQIDRVLQAVSSRVNPERDRLIFWMYYRDGMTASSIALAPGIELSVKGVESTIQRLTRLVRNEIVESRQLNRVNCA